TRTGPVTSGIGGLGRGSAPAIGDTSRAGVGRRSPRRVDGTAQECSELVYGRGVVGDDLRRAEPAVTGLVTHLSTSEGQGLFGEILREPDRLRGGMSKVPAVDQQVVETYLQSIHAAHR